MKRLIVTFVISLNFLMSARIEAQDLTISLPETGSTFPVTWTHAPEVGFEDGVLTLNSASANQTGYVYYNQKVQQSINCFITEIDFDFKVDTTSGVANGFAFWFLQNLPDNFASNGGLGVPDSNSGLVFAFDTYSNTPPHDAPIITCSLLDDDNYVEGDSLTIIASSEPNQNYMLDGNWHHVKIYIMEGLVMLFVDNMVIPKFESFLDLPNEGGYFGFSATTSDTSYSIHSLKNVQINSTYPYSFPLPPLTLEVCSDTLAHTFPYDEIIEAGLEVHYFNGEDYSDRYPEPFFYYTNEPGVFTYYAAVYDPVCELYNSMSTIKVVVRTPDTVYRSIEKCVSETINFAGKSYSEAGNDTLVLTSSKGCDSVVYLSIVNKENVYDTLYDEICEGQNLVFNDHIYAEAGTFVIPNPDSCNLFTVLIINIVSVDDFTFNYQLQNESVCMGDTILIEGSGADHYRFYCNDIELFNLDNKIAIPLKYTENYFKVRGLYGGECYIEKTFYVAANSCSGLLVPNAFSPNGDGLNDQFQVKPVTYVQSYSIEIFDRLGQMIFRSDNVNNSWDGTFKGKMMPGGVYFYRILGVNPDNTYIKMKGSITLVL